MILCDRGVLDSKCFCDAEDFQELMHTNGWTEEYLLERYSLVLHMTTAAIGAEK